MENSDLGPTINTLKAEVDFLDGELAAAKAENERLRAALERIVDTDPDDGTAWFHNVARAALEGK